MRITRTNLLSLGLVIGAFVITAALYNRLPESVPTHWNARGEANGFTPKPWGPFILPLTMVGVYFPRTSSRSSRRRSSPSCSW